MANMGRRDVHEHGVPQGQHDVEDCLSSQPRTGSSVNMTGKEAAFNVVADSFCCPNVEPETTEVRVSTECKGPSERDEVRKRLSALDCAAVEEHRDRSAARDDQFTPMTELQVTQERARLEGRLDASCGESLKVHAELKTAVQRWEQEILQQKRLLARHQDESALIKQENEKLRELVKDFQDKTCDYGTTIGKLREDVNNLRPNRDDMMDRVLAHAVSQLCHDNCGLRDDLGKYQIHLEAVQEQLSFKCNEVESLRENLFLLEAANYELQQKAESNVDQLSKERAGQLRAEMEDKQTVILLEFTAKEMFNSITVFSSLLSKYQNAGGHNPAYASVVETELWKEVGMMTQEHDWRDLSRHLICLKLFHDFQTETFASHQGEVLFLDQKERTRNCLEYFKCCENSGALEMAVRHGRQDKFDLLFLNYLGSRSRLLLPREFRPICEDFKKSYELTAARLSQILSGVDVHNQSLIQSFIVAVEKVWQFHKLCFSIEPPATMFRVEHGTSFDPKYMENIAPLENDFGTEQIGFVVYPGFRFRDFIIKCLVFAVAV